MSDNIISKLKEIHKKHRVQSGDVSTQTKDAQMITREWQKEVVKGKIIKSEVRVSEMNNERFDLVDYEKLIAYELKVSGKNTHHEFYKNVIKVLTHNCNNEIKLEKLVFLSEKKGIDSLEKRIDHKFKELLKDAHNITIELIPLE
ncbi:hypothetical protein [Flavobacterium gelatinilyticum]|uniref:hypothetical protein n=1 Tax=Flavobacterium gelatinilyticum TaxID=3003260 RepID=UPI00247FDE21|nr:hypothetical protein [Flavobacterium gelatinilyticum]